MRKPLFATLIFCIAFNSYAQINFEKGYFIDNNGEKTVCWIKNKGWVSNPEEFEYKTAENGAVELAGISSVKEFGIPGVLKYERFSVEMDKSPSSMSHLSHNKNPEFEERSLFLKVLTEGEGTLYLYDDNNSRKFFFRVNDAPVEQLIFKKYRVSGNKIGENDHFRQQLWARMRCESLSMKEVQRLSYTKSDLMKYFMRFNTCKNSPATTYNKDKKAQFNLKIVPGISFLSFSLFQPGSLYNTEKNIEFDNMISFRPGIEAEFVMPFNKNKWAFFLQPSYQRFKSNEESIIVFNIEEDRVYIDYSAIEVPLGVRHYFFLSDDARLSVSAAFVIDFSLNSKIDFENRSDVKIRNSNTVAFGFGYNKDRYGIELRYALNRNTVDIEDLQILDPWESNYGFVTLNLSYKIFK